MMKLKTVLLCACLSISLLSNAKPRHIDFKLDSTTRSLNPIIPIEATFDDELRELTLMLFDNGYSILVEVKDESSKIQIPLKGLTPGKYTLSISDEKDHITGDFIY